MFTPPVLQSEPREKVLAADLVERINQFAANCKKFQREQFKAFWFRDGLIRSAEEINATLQYMDEAEPGQSIKLFQSAAGLVQLILAMTPDSLQDADWMPPYEYAVDQQTGSLRVTTLIPTPGDEEEPT